MKRLLAAASVAVGLMALALPAQAKGEGGKITIGGGGGSGGAGGAGGGGGPNAAVMSKPIHLNGRGSAFWFDATGFGQSKFAQPSSMGTPLSRTQLGPSLAVTASFLCGPNERESIHQTLYPYAKGGPQIYTPAKQFMCGMDLQKGWWPIGRYSHLLATLVSHGMPRVNPVAAGSAVGSSGDVVPAGKATWPLVLAGLAALAVVLLSGAIVQRRRVRLPM
jgi:hypothetical protein